MDDMQPYYDDGVVTIYHGDCREVVPVTDTTAVAMLLTDPPYGINHDTRSHLGRWTGSIAGDDEPFDPRPWLTYPKVVLWGANYYAHLLPPSGWIIWSKAQDNRWAENEAHHRSTAEVAWTNLQQGVSVYNCFWMGSPLYRTTERGTNLHPNQKPVSLMAWILNRHTAPGDLILDPYMGSGPIAQACHLLGRRYIGIEIEEKYCAVAAGRLTQGVLPLDVA